ncbi:MAG: [FeFe] hydrogenase H-cluster maturation GTPase HydF [Bacteroides sp.]|nr:[FeFe] hydrogenase H-cluster maturation GTPase HydF [Bacteroides sp.]
MSLSNVANSERLHITIIGKTNSGKSSLINAITNQEVAIVSDYKGTTTDSVNKAMELPKIGAVVFTDTAGFDDNTEIGNLRVEKTRRAIEKTDIAIVVISADDQDLLSDNPLKQEKEWITNIKKSKTPTILVLNKIDTVSETDTVENLIKKTLGLSPIKISSKQRIGIEEIHNAILQNIPEDYGQQSITRGLVKEDDTVLLVMPQDIQAPKGRLILPQVQTIRELLDKKCVIISCTTDKLANALNSLKNPPKLIITDSQVFKQVYEMKPEQSLLTSFSVLFAAYKGDIELFVQGAKHFEKINERSKILIAEACTHAPQTEDIGRVKIPNMLRKRFGEGISIDIVSGTSFPDDLTVYDLIIHCGACMFNRKYVLSRVEKVKIQKVPITNYGIAIAYLTGILDKIKY